LARVWLGADRVSPQERFNFPSGGDYGLHLLLSNYGEAVRGPAVAWRLREETAVLLSGGCAGADVAQGAVGELCRIAFRLPETDTPRTLALSVTVTFPGGQVRNQWPVFLYPAPAGLPYPIGVYDPAGLFAGCEALWDTIPLGEGIPEGTAAVLASGLTPWLRAYVEGGGRALMVQRGLGPLPTVSVPFWREGMLCRDYPSFWNRLPHTHWAEDLRFFSLAPDTAFTVEGCAALGPARPMVRRFDCRQWLAAEYMCDIALGRGRLLATTLRLEGGMGKQPLFLKNNCLGRWIVEQSLGELL
jgi:hypothetical protein